MEIGILRRILKRAKRWHFVEDEIPHLSERGTADGARQPDEKLRLLEIAQSKPESETADPASMLALLHLDWYVFPSAEGYSEPDPQNR